MKAPSGKAPIDACWIGWVLVAMVLGCPAVGPAAGDGLRLTGEAVQGGLILGRVGPTDHVTVDGRPVRVADDGRFVFGIGRDDGPEIRVAVRPDQGPTQVHVLVVKSRTYPEQRVDGLPPDRVHPGPEDLARIRQEALLARQAREIDDPRTDFARGFIWPVVGRITGVYGSRRILNGEPRQPHYGVDIAAPVGTSVRAPADGRVTLVHPDMFFSGKTLILDHGHGVSSTFLHLHRISVAEGQRVRQGQIIAEVGATGRVSGPHLDWRMNWFDRRLDPMRAAGPMPQQ